MPDPVAAARIEAAAYAKAIWPEGSPEQFMQAEKALRVYFIAKGVTPFEAWTSYNMVESVAEFEDDFGLPMPRMPLADELRAQIWYDARDVAWRSIDRSFATIGSGPPWDFEVQVAFDHRAWLATTDSEHDGQISGSIDEPLHS